MSDPPSSDSNEALKSVDGVAQTVGAIRIYLEMAFQVVAIIALIGAGVWVRHYQRQGWTTEMDTVDDISCEGAETVCTGRDNDSCTKQVSCDVKTEEHGDFFFTFRFESRPRKGDSIPVYVDPNGKATLQGPIPAIVGIALYVAAGVLVLVLVLYIIFRRNRWFRRIKGAQTAFDFIRG